MTQLSSSDVPRMGRRQFMNLLTFGSVTGVALGALYPVANYFIPPKAAGSGGGTSAKDELGNAITASGWLSSHPEGDRSLVQGLKGDPTYLIVEGEDAIGSYGINAICTISAALCPGTAAPTSSCALAMAASTTPQARWFGGQHRFHSLWQT